MSIVPQRKIGNAGLVASAQGLLVFSLFSCLQHCELADCVEFIEDAWV
jgi:hypothetical protein